MSIIAALEITSFVPRFPTHEASLAAFTSPALKVGLLRLSGAFRGLGGLVGIQQTPDTFSQRLGEQKRLTFQKALQFFSIAAKTILSHSRCIPCGFAKGVCQGQKLAELRSLRKIHGKIQSADFPSVSGFTLSS